MKTLSLIAFFLIVSTPVTYADCQLTLNLFVMESSRTEVLTKIESTLAPGCSWITLTAGQKAVFYTFSQGSERSALRELKGNLLVSCENAPVELNLFFAPPGSFLSGKTIKN